MTRLFLPAISLVFASLLVACGGSGGGDSAPEPVIEEVPAAASTSAAGMATWMTGLAASASSADAKEPLDIAKFAPPLSDNTEPETLK